MTKLHGVEPVILAHIKKQYPQTVGDFRLVAGQGGWHIIGSDDQIYGKIIRQKGSDRRSVLLHGTVGKIKEILSSGILASLV
jgi:hypothetical protein